MGIEPFEWLVLTLFFAAGLVPMALLFFDYRKRRHIHKPFIYVLVFIASWILLAKVLLDALGIWLALIAPFAVFGYVAIMRWAMKGR
jgi:hypothetical protein